MPTESAKSWLVVLAANYLAIGKDEARMRLERAGKYSNEIPLPKSRVDNSTKILLPDGEEEYLFLAILGAIYSLPNDDDCMVWQIANSFTKKLYEEIDRNTKTLDIDLLSDSEHVWKSHLKTAGKLGARARHRKAEPLKEIVRKAVEAAPENKSASQLAVELEDEILEVSRLVGYSLKPSNARNTIARWIREYRNIISGS